MVLRWLDRKTQPREVSNGNYSRVNDARKRKDDSWPQKSP